jgi:hypothetical protein
MYFEASNVALDNVTDWLSFSICVQVQLEDTRGPEKEMRSSPSTGSHAQGRQDLPEVGLKGSQDSNIRIRTVTLTGDRQSIDGITHLREARPSGFRKSV